MKKWLAEVGAQRIDQMIDPELTFQMAVEDYRRQGYSDRWINERMRSIEMRKELTDEWHRSGIHEPKDFAVLTNVLTKAWSGMTTGEYKLYCHNCHYCHFRMPINRAFVAVVTVKKLFCYFFPLPLFIYSRGDMP